MAGITAASAAPITENAAVIETAYVRPVVNIPALGVDLIVTGGKIPRSQLGVMKYLDVCDADCQAKRLGLIFNE